MGDSLKQVKSFPDVVRRDIGSSLYDAQKDVDLIKRLYKQAVERSKELD
jgi:phage-related protein